MDVTFAPLRYRLGIDLGSASLGWSILRLDATGTPDYLLRLGIRIFSSGRNQKDGTSLAATRRLARQMRRRRDRLLARKRQVLKTLTEGCLFPTDDAERKALRTLDPYELRFRGLNQALLPHELGRAIYHLAQRRGFRSSRRSDKAVDDHEQGKVADGISRLQQLIDASGAETVGALLHLRKQAGLGTRARRTGDGAKSAYDFYIDRASIAKEFDLLWSRQRTHHAGLLNDSLRNGISHALFHQRPLKPVNPGRCSFEPSEPRAPLALPSVQRFRIGQEVNNIRIRPTAHEAERALTNDERSKLVVRLCAGKDLNFDQLRKMLHLAPNAAINLASIKRDRLKGNATNKVLSNKSAFGKDWHDRPIEEQDAIVCLLIDDTLTEEQLVERLSSSLDRQQAERLLKCRLPDGYARLSLKAIRKILPMLEDEGLTFDKAAASAGYATVASGGDGSLDLLPYYGITLERHVAFGSGKPGDTDEQRYGRIANPSVHIALNELRKLINALIERYGKPAEVVLELTRELKLGWQRAREIEREQATQQQENEKLRAEIEALGHPATRENILRLRLFRELSKNSGITTPCVYTGEQIGISQLFSNEVHVDHILPYGRCLDDSIANKVLCKHRANLVKGGSTPFEAFSHSPTGFGWSTILERASRLSRNRLWRFEEDAMKRLSDDGGFLARQLTDTAYMSRLAREYLRAVCPDVWVVAGRLTSMIRHRWGLNRLIAEDDVKNRRDHRHHAIDATVIACIDRGLVKRVADSAQRATAAGAGRLIENLELPWPSFILGMRNALERVVISFRPDHSPLDALHNQTAYGAVDAAAGHTNVDDIRQREVQSYVPLYSLVDCKAGKVLEHVVDARYAKALDEILSTAGPDKTARKSALHDFTARTGIKRLRWRENLRVIPIRDRSDGRIYKYFKGDSNYCYEIFVGANGKWTGHIIDTFTANQKAYQEFRADSKRYRRLTFSGAPLVMRLTIGDYVAVVTENSSRTIYRLQKMTQGKLSLCLHTAAGDPFKDERVRASNVIVMSIAPSRLQTLQGRRVFVDILGRVFDPGFVNAGTHR